MKFKIEKKDLIMFVIYSILLLYLCAIAILNFTSLLNEGEFYGLMPFKAFTMPYLPVTLLLFIGALIAIFSSVSSYIFKKDKGHGIGLKLKSKESDGYAKWADDKEVKKGENVVKINRLADDLDAAGIPLINNEKETYIDNGEYHSLILGSTGSGKTQTIVKPMVNFLAKKGESMIITDPKGEIYQNSAHYLKSRGYNIIVLNFREPQNGNSWNPLTLPYQYYKEGNIDKATELLDDVALNILYDPNNKSDSDFWEKGSADYFSGLALGLFMDASEKEINLNSINYMATVGEERCGASHYINEYFRFKGEDSSPYMFASTVINAPSDTKGGLLSTFRQKIRIFSTQENLSEMLSYSDFDLRKIGSEKTAIFMIIHDEKKTYHSLMTIFIKQCYETLIDEAQKQGGKLPIRTNFILDEFANMPPLKDVDAMISAARSRLIRFTFIIQDFAQLNSVYGEEVAQIIRGNCNNLIYLISAELKALEEISKMCGEVKVTDDKDKNATRPLVSITDLQKMKLFEGILIRTRMNPYKIKLQPDFKINWGIPKIEEPYPVREKRPVEIFDLKKFVMDERTKLMAEQGENGMGIPGMGGNPFDNPFASTMNPFNLPPTMMPSPGKQAPSPKSNNLDLDAILKDIDEKMKNFMEEEEEAKQQEKEELVNDHQDEEPVEVIEDLPQEVESKEEENKESESKEEKPKINVDADSIIVNENVITDDEFFDDFFGDE